ncbi:MAG: hypothetical protein PHG82_02170 [Candidatus Gracilibacteria bacterium]|nr:hypothetical protein [Candidatus Gracilibacteria bacterium]
MVGNSSNSTSSGVPEEKILREYFDNKGINKLVPEFKEKATDVLENTQETREFTGNREALEIAGLEEFDLGEPTCPDIIKNPEYVSAMEPLAWEYKGRWYYNHEGAMREAAFLGKEIPDLEDWERICKPYGKDGERMAKELGLSFIDKGLWVTGPSYNNQINDAIYCTRSYCDSDEFKLFFTFRNIYPNNCGRRDAGRSVRLLKNAA